MPSDPPDDELVVPGAYLAASAGGQRGPGEDLESTPNILPHGGAPGIDDGGDPGDDPEDEPPLEAEDLVDLFMEIADAFHRVMDLAETLCTEEAIRPWPVTFDGDVNSFVSGGSVSTLRVDVDGHLTYRVSGVPSSIDLTAGRRFSDGFGSGNLILALRFVENAATCEEYAAAAALPAADFRLIPLDPGTTFFSAGVPLMISPAIVPATAVGVLIQVFVDPGLLLPNTTMTWSIVVR